MVGRRSGARRYKENFDPHSNKVRIVRIAGNLSCAKKDFSVQLSNDQMIKFFEPVLQQNFALIRRGLSSKVKAIVVAGGLSKSTYFMDRLQEEFKSSDAYIDSVGMRAIGSCNPVTRGTMLKYHNIQARALPTTDCFGISEDQVYDRRVHHDLVDVFGNAQPPRPQARSSQYYRDDYAKSRWRTIVPDGNRVRRSIWQLRTVQLREDELGYWVQGEENIWIQVYWSSKQRDENSPIFTENDGEQLCEGIEKFGAPLCIELPDLAQEKFTLKRPDLMLGKKLRDWQYGDCRACHTRRCIAEEFYEVYYRLELTFSGANIYFRVEFAKPKKNAAIAYRAQLGPNDVIRMGGQSLLISETQNPNPRV
ncbi:hypothetical protein CKM354_000663600 [Cercospora kikuchii]|uniref:Uncharacterized protein n=1 Tax=Cercospora kikuchii TaxID=84275 RepID=A0A9P3CS51_9PEZI|nr:uncharacterized protein CKM354_000663600 [Cercospora kikuchii]GIZ43408.1 hypothetical protein CKM354_000663600 [Cercospora kikuchii]